ncbi:hypothetical protein ABPG73_004313 [Tetrahymena malaccensis]
MKQIELIFQEGSPQLKQKQEQTENDVSTLQTIIAGNSSSPDNVMRQKISQLSEGKSRPKFNRISFQKCENFDEDVVDPKKIVKSSNKGLRLRQIINGLFQTSIILFNCFYAKNGEYIYATFGFVLGCISQWLLMDIHLDKFTIQQIKKLQKQRVTQSKSPRKKENQKLSPKKTINRKISKNSSLNQSKLSNNIKALSDNQKKIELNEICQIQQLKRESNLNINHVEDFQNNQDNSLNKNQSHSLNKQFSSTIQQNTSFQNNRRVASIMGISDNQRLKQSRGSSQQQSPKNMHENSNIIQNLIKLNFKNEQTMKYEKRITQLLQRKSTALTDNDFISLMQQKHQQKKSQSNQDNDLNVIVKEQEDQNAQNRSQKQIKSRRKSIKSSTYSSAKSKKKGKSQQKKSQNDEMTVLKKANWCQMLRQLNYQWIQYLINLLPLITMAVKDQDTLRNLLLLQFLRGIFIIDALISYYQVELTHQYTEYTRIYLNLNPFKFVTIYLILLIILSSYIYYVIENFNTLWDSIWNIIVSITTIGYGDIAPQTYAGRTLIIVVSNISVVFLSFITSFIQNMQEFSKEQQQSFDKNLRELKERKIKIKSIFVIKYYFEYHLPPSQEIISKIRSKKSFQKINLKQIDYQDVQIPIQPHGNINIEQSKEQQMNVNQEDNALNEFQEQTEKNNEQNKDVNTCIYQFQTFEDQNKFVGLIKTFQDQNQQILKRIEEIKNYHENNIIQNEESNESYEISSDNTKCKHTNKISQNNSIIPETPKQTPINIPSNFKTMTFQAGTNRSINTCETPVHNTRRVPQPFNSKLCIEDDSSNNLSRLQTCKGDADPNTIESSQQINNLIIFNQSSEQIQSSKNFASQNQVCKFSSCSDLEGTSIITAKVKYNRNCIKDINQKQETNKAINDQKNTFKKRTQQQEDECDFSENQSEFSKINQKMVNQKKQNEQLAKKDDQNYESDIYHHVHNLDNSGSCSNSQIAYNQISAPPSSLPLAKFLKKDLQQNKLSSEEFGNEFEQEDEEQQSNKTEAHSQNKKVDSSKRKMNQNSIIPGFTDKYLKSNPKFLQDVNNSNESKVPKISKIRQFSLDIPICQQGDKFILFNNNQQSLAEEQNLKQEEEI